MKKYVYVNCVTLYFSITPDLAKQASHFKQKLEAEQ